MKHKKWIYLLVVMFVFSVVLFEIFPSRVFAATEDASSYIALYSQCKGATYDSKSTKKGKFTLSYWDKELAKRGVYINQEKTDNYPGISNDGCRLLSYVHLTQYLSKKCQSTDEQLDLLEAFARLAEDPSASSAGTKYDSYLIKQYGAQGITRKSIGSKPSFASFKTFFDNGGAAVINIPGHFFIVVGYIEKSGNQYLLAVDSSYLSTLKRLNSKTGYSVGSFSKLVYSSGQTSGTAKQYWIEYKDFINSGCTVTNAYSSTKRVSPTTPVTNTNLEFKSITCPTNYKIGSSGGYKLTGGTLVSNEELKTITSTIKKTDGTVISGPKTRNISGKSYNIQSLDTYETSDNGVHFSWIKTAGNYVWILTATDASGKTLTLEMPFTASSNATTSTTRSIGWTAKIAVTGVSLDQSSLVIKKNEAATLAATISPDNAANKSVSWSSDNPAVATVDGSGKVTAVAPGTAMITVTTADGGKTATCLVTVPAGDNLSLADRIRIAILNDEYNPELDLNNDGKTNAQDYILAKKAELEPIAVPVTGIVWDTMEFRPGETGNVQYAIYPKDATNQSVYCDPYEDEICSVSADGRIYAKKNGYSYVCIHSAEDPEICSWGVICVYDPIQYIYEATVEPSGIIDIHFMATTNDKDKLSGFHLYQDNYNTHFVMQKSIIPDYNGPEIKEIQDDDWGSGQIFIVETNPRDNVIRADQEITYRLLPDNIDELWGTQQTYSFSFLPYYQYGVGHPYEKAKVNLSINVTFPEKDVPRSGIEQFVYRCYDIILGRQPDAGGMDTWVNELNSGRKAASEIIDNFVRSQEFLGKHYSNADAVEILYKAMLGRGSDPAGKADWVGKLDAGYPFAVVINGFCGSKEFKEICDTYGIAPGSVSMEQESVSDQQIRAFVTRCYKIILGRDADEVGMNTWFNELKSRRRTAAEIIEQFVYSQEFQNKKYSNPDAVEILYKAMLGRGSDPAGKADWVGRLAGGQPLTAIINGFCGSMEFTAICEAYGITPGSVKVETVSKAAEEVPEETAQKPERKANLIEITNASDTVNENLGTAVQAIYINEEKAKEFVGRCYRVILGREASQAELDSWIGQMMNGSKTADQIARGFLFSGEFKGRNIGNEELVKILYRVYMNREADPEGLATWTQKLDEGTSLNDLLDIFSKTNEFKAVIKNMAQ